LSKIIKSSSPLITPSAFVDKFLDDIENCLLVGRKTLEKCFETDSIFPTRFCSKTTASPFLIPSSSPLLITRDVGDLNLPKEPTTWAGKSFEEAMSVSLN